MKIIITIIAAMSLLGLEGVANAESMPAPASATISSVAPPVQVQNRHIKRHHFSHRPHRHMIPKR